MKAAFAIALAIASSTAARAQIVNVQPLLAKEPHPGFAAAVEAAVDWRTGNTDLLLVSGSALGRYHLGRHLVFAYVRGELGKKSGANFIDRDLEHLRYRLRVLRFVDGEAFVQHDRDAFRRLALRAIGGAGPRLQIARSRLVEAAVAVAYMLEYERLREGKEPDAGRATLAHRLSGYVTLFVRVGERLKIGHTVFVQPRLDARRDVRLLSETELLVAATQHVALKNSLTLTFDSQPPVGVSALDTTLKSSIQISF